RSPGIATMKLRHTSGNGLGSAGVLARRARRLAGRIFQRHCAAALAAVFFSCPPPSSAAAPDAAPAAAHPPANAVAPQQLSQSIDQVLQKREFAWRMP